MSQLFELSYLNKQYDFNRLHSQWIPLETAIDIASIETEKLLVRTNTGRSYKTVFNLSQDKQLQQHVKTALDELVNEESIKDYSIGFRTKKCEASFALDPAVDTAIGKIMFKGLVNNKDKSIWFTPIIAA